MHPLIYTLTITDRLSGLIHRFPLLRSGFQLSTVGMTVEPLNPSRGKQRTPTTFSQPSHKSFLYLFVMLSDMRLADLNILLVGNAPSTDSIVDVFDLNSVWQRSKGTLAEQQIDLF
jgi:hypothetical protein